MIWNRLFRKSRIVYECYVCSGTGKNKKDESCSKCLGTGTLDWIENIVGKHNIINIDTIIFRMRNRMGLNKNREKFNE